MTKPALNEEMYLNQRIIQLKDLISKDDVIIEVLEKSNGTAVKFWNGTMICAALVTGTSNLSDYWGQFKRTNEHIPVTFPVPFVNTPIVIATGAAYEGIVSVLISDRLKDQFKFTALKPNANTGTNYAFLYWAIGKWK